MSVRTIVELHLPLEMGAVGRIMQAVAREYPDAVIGSGISPARVMINADDDVRLTKPQRRRIARDRAAAAALQAVDDWATEAGGAP